jgi:hypothetical protein
MAAAQLPGRTSIVEKMHSQVFHGLDSLQVFQAKWSSAPLLIMLFTAIKLLTSTGKSLAYLQASTEFDIYCSFRGMKQAAWDLSIKLCYEKRKHINWIRAVSFAGPWDSGASTGHEPQGTGCLRVWDPSGFFRVQTQICCLASPAAESLDSGITLHRHKTDWTIRPPNWCFRKYMTLSQTNRGRALWYKSCKREGNRILRSLSFDRGFSDRIHVLTLV